VFDVSIRFGPFVVNPLSRQVLREEAEVHLSTKAFQLLCSLLTRRPDVVSKAELLRLVWPDSFVVDANLNVVIGEIRRALGDDPQHPQYIRTVHGVGYAFCADAIEEDRGQRRGPRSAARFWIQWKDQTFPLTDGDNVVGRHPECSIWLNESGVSRRHARIFVDGLSGRVLVEDLNSTNGTSVRQKPVTAPQPLSDGDVLQIGSAELTFRTWSADASRETERIRRR
jgi:DNA-binding winged helix-turn-helix (wHTH) protein